MPWEPLPNPEGPDPRPLGVPLDALMDRLVGTTVSVTQVIYERWPEIVGEGLAAYSAPGRLQDGTLHVTVREAAYSTELKWMEETIIERVAALAGRGVPASPIERVQVRVERR